MYTWVMFFSSERYILTQAMWNHLLMHALIEIQIFFKINNLFNVPGKIMAMKANIIVSLEEIFPQ